MIRRVYITPVQRIIAADTSLSIQAPIVSLYIGTGKTTCTLADSIAVDKGRTILKSRRSLGEKEKGYIDVAFACDGIPAFELLNIEIVTVDAE